MHKGKLAFSCAAAIAALQSCTSPTVPVRAIAPATKIVAIGCDTYLGHRFRPNINRIATLPGASSWHVLSLRSLYLGSQFIVQGRLSRVDSSRPGGYIIKDSLSTQTYKISVRSPGPDWISRLVGKGNVILFLRKVSDKSRDLTLTTTYDSEWSFDHGFMKDLNPSTRALKGNYSARPSSSLCKGRAFGAQSPRNNFREATLLDARITSLKQKSFYATMLHSMPVLLLWCLAYSEVKPQTPFPTSLCKRTRPPSCFSPDHVRKVLHIPGYF